MKRLLLVDDDADLLAVLFDHFNGRYELVTALDGASALEHFDRRRPDAVFLDIGMPGLSGVEVMKRMVEAAPDVPIIMLTGNAETRVAEDCLRHGAFAWIPKPVDLVYLDHIAASATEQKPTTP